MLNSGFRSLKIVNKFSSTFNKLSSKSFSGGPYNPTHYKYKLVGTRRATTEEHYFASKKMKEFDALPLYNMRHVHPIRQSGPIPPYYGDYTMEDVRKAGYELRAPYEAMPESTDIDELMRRVPGLTRKEAIKIQSLGLSPFEELDYAYLVVNNGIDVFYESNNGYLFRQVVTNSKGEKVECLFPSNESDEFTYMNMSMHKGEERMDHAYDPVPGEPPVSAMPDYELGVPNSFFEYEMDNRLHSLMAFDQNLIPESERPCPTPKNPHCSKDFWKPQSDLKEEDQMNSPDWFPNNTAYNVYQKKEYYKDKQDYTDQNLK